MQVYERKDEGQSAMCWETAGELALFSRLCGNASAQVLCRATDCAAQAALESYAKQRGMHDGKQFAGKVVPNVPSDQGLQGPQSSRF